MAYNGSTNGRPPPLSDDLQIFLARFGDVDAWSEMLPGYGRFFIEVMTRRRSDATGWKRTRISMQGDRSSLPGRQPPNRRR